MHSNKINFVIFKFWKSILWAVIIAIGLLTPGDKLPKQNLLHLPYFDKILHFVIFLFLEWLLLFDAISINTSASRSNRKLVLTAIALSYGCMTEIAQWLFSYKREGDIFDFLADSAGILVALFSFDYMYRTIIRFSRRN